MNRLNQLTDDFKFKLDKFLIGCDALEELNEWDKNTYGEMDAYYQNDMIGIILRLIAADGEIEDPEVEYLNKNFGFEYTTEELRDVYAYCHDAFDLSFDEQVKAGITLIQSINEKLAIAYKDLVVLICDIICESDGVVEAEEVAEIERVKTAILGEQR